MEMLEGPSGKEHWSCRVSIPLRSLPLQFLHLSESSQQRHVLLHGPSGFLGRICLVWCYLGGGVRAAGEADGLKLVWGRDRALMAGGDQDFGGKNEGKGHLNRAEHHPVPSTLQREGSCSQQNPPGRGAPASLRSPRLAWQGWGISRRNKSQVLLKKDISCGRGLAWRGERALCCNRGEGGPSSDSAQSSRSTRPLLVPWHHQQQEQGTRRDTAGDRPGWR